MFYRNKLSRTVLSYPVEQARCERSILKPESCSVQLGPSLPQRLSFQCADITMTVCSDPCFFDYMHLFFNEKSLLFQIPIGAHLESELILYKPAETTPPKNMLASVYPDMSISLGSCDHALIKLATISPTLRHRDYSPGSNHSICVIYCFSSLRIYSLCSKFLVELECSNCTNIDYTLQPSISLKFTLRSILQC